MPKNPFDKIRIPLPPKPPKTILNEKDLHSKKLRKYKPEDEEREEKLPDIWEKDMGEDEEYQEWLAQQNKYSSNNIDNFIKLSNKRIKISYIQHLEGHKDSKGEIAPWVIKSHITNKIISSHKTEQEAKDHLKDINIHKAYNYSNIDELIKKAFVDEDSIDYFINKTIENIVLSSGQIDIINPEFVTDLISLIVDDEISTSKDVKINTSIDNNINVPLLKYNLNKLFPIELRKKIMALPDTDINKKILIENFSEYTKQFKNEIDTIDWEVQINDITNQAFNGSNTENLDEVSDNLEEEKLRPMNTLNY